MPGKRRLTVEEFDRITPHMQRFSKKNLAAIRRILVDGAKQKDVALQLNLSKEAVSAMVRRAWNAHLDFGDHPPGWVKVVAAFPPEMAAVILELARITRARAGKD